MPLPATLHPEVLTAMLPAAYWILVLIAGAALVGLVPVAWRWPERLALTVLVGMVASTLASYGLAYGLGVSVASALGGPALVAGLAAAAAWRLGVRPAEPWVRAARSLNTRARGAAAPGLELGTAIVLLLGGAGLFLIVQRALMAGPGGTLDSGYAGAWWDYGIHAWYAEYFASSHHFPPVEVYAAGQVLRYPFMADFQSGLLLVLGQSLVSALIIPSWLVIWAAVALVWSLGRRMFRTRWAGLCCALVVMFGCGVGFARLYPDTCQTQTPAAAGAAALVPASACSGLQLAAPATLAAVVRGLPATLTHLPRGYDGDFALNTPQSAPFADMELYMPLVTYWVPQRDWAWGVALLTAYLICAFVALRERRRGLAIATGVLGAGIIFFEPFSWITAVVLTGCWWLAYRRRELGLQLLPLLALGLPTALYDYLGPHGQLHGVLGSNLYPTLQLGWAANQGSACTAAQVTQGAPCAGLYLSHAHLAAILHYLGATLSSGGFWSALVSFWWINTGLFIPIALATLIGVAIANRRGRPTASLPAELAVFAAPAFIMFALINVVTLTPLTFDGTKVAYDWYLVTALPVGGVLAVGLRHGWLTRIASALGLGTLIASGLLGLLVVLPQQAPPPAGASAPGPMLTFAGPDEVQVARLVRRRVPAGATMLTEGDPQDPVTVLAGHPVVLGYDWEPASWGEPVSHDLAVVQAMYRGCPASAHPCRALRLLHRYHVGYVELEPSDYNHITVNSAWFSRERFPVVARVGPYTIYRIPSY